MNKVRCRICHKILGAITDRHLKLHSISSQVYREMFPNAPFHRGRTVWNKGKKGVQKSLKRGLANKEYYGKKRAQEISKKISMSVPWKGKTLEEYFGKKRAKEIIRQRSEKLSKVNHTKEWNAKVSRARKGIKVKKEMARKISETLKRKYKTGELINSFKGKHHSKRTRELLKRYNKNRPPEILEQISKTLKRKYRTGEINNRNAVRGVKRFWRNMTKKQREEFVRKRMKECNVKPNKEEKYLDKIIQKAIPGEFKYTGDGKMSINGMIPDWTNCNGKKVVIELFGAYWHLEYAGLKDIPQNRKKVEQKRINAYKKWGYNCLVLWNDEIYNNDLSERLKEFVGGR